MRSQVIFFFTFAQIFSSEKLFMDFQTSESLTFPQNVMKFCPFCGMKPFRARTENFMQCAACHKRLYINASGAVACVIENAEGEILLARRAFAPAKGMLDLPGGFVNPDETAEDAARREVKEELNLDVESLQYICSACNHYLYGELTYFTLDLGFKCSVSDFSAMRADDDVSGYLFAPRQRIDMREICFPSIRTILRTYFEKF